MFHFKIVYTTNELGAEAPVADCPVFNTFAKDDDEAVADLFDTIPDILSGQITHKTKVTRRTT